MRHSAEVVKRMKTGRWIGSTSPVLGSGAVAQALQSAQMTC
jgi:hypothetical protein